MSLSVNQKPVYPKEAATPVQPAASVAPIKQATSLGSVTPIPITAVENQALEERPLNAEVLEKALDAANQKFVADGRELQFELDRDTNRTIVRLVDKGTQEVLRQFPSEVALRLARLATEGKSLHSILV